MKPISARISNAALIIKEDIREKINRPFIINREIFQNINVQIYNNIETNITKHIS